MAEPILPNMHAVRIRGVGILKEQRTTLLTVMDSTNGNKVILFIKVISITTNKTNHMVEATTPRNKEAFVVTDITSDMSFIKVGDETIASISISTQDTDFTLMVMGQHETLKVKKIDNLHQPKPTNYKGYKIINSEDISLCTIDNGVCPATVEVLMERELSLEQKLLTLSFAIKSSLLNFQIHRLGLPNICGVSFTSQRFPPRVLRQNASEETVLDTGLMQFRLRPACANQNILYYDIIDVLTNNVVLSAEFEPTAISQHVIEEIRTGEQRPWSARGQVKVKESSGALVSTIVGYMNDNSMIIYKGANELLACYSDKRYYDKDKRVFHLVIVVEKFKDENQADAKAVDVVRAYDRKFGKVASIWLKDCAVEIETYCPMTAEAKMLILAQAFRASSVLYGLDRLPVPDMRLLYVNAGIPRGTQALAGSVP